jgi:hypothetical protein
LLSLGLSQLSFQRLLGDARKDLESVVRYSERMQPGHRGAAARLHHLKFSNNGIPISGLRQPEYAVGYGKDGISLFLGGVLAE